MSNPDNTRMPFTVVIAIIAGLMGAAGSCTSIAATGVVAIRVFTQTETRLDEVDRRVGKVESMATTTAADFNGPARAAHERLIGRVDLLEAELKTKASHEAMQSLALEMRQNFDHVISLLNEVRDVRRQDHKER